MSNEHVQNAPLMKEAAPMPYNNVQQAGGYQQQGYQQQGYQQQPVMGAPSPQVMGGMPPLWPNGIGVTFLKEKEGECGCPPCACCAQPFWYTDQQRNFMGNESRIKYGICTLFHPWEVENGDAMGVPMTFKSETSCCAQCGGHDLVHVEHSGRSIGHVKMYYPCCSCTHQVVTEAFDTAGNSRFTRHDNPCTRSNFLLQNEGCCKYWEIQYPINGPAVAGMGTVPLTYMINRVHPCGCYPTWTGFRQWPMGVSSDDQMLLLAMIHARIWRTEQNRQNESAAAAA